MAWSGISGILYVGEFFILVRRQVKFQKSTRVNIMSKAADLHVQGCFAHAAASTAIPWIEAISNWTPVRKVGVLVCHSSLLLLAKYLRVY